MTPPDYHETVNLANFEKSDGSAIITYDEDTNAVAVAAAVDLGAHSLGGQEIADPAAPAANHGVLYFRDNGSGKTQLVARFPTGAVQVVATEP